MTGTAVRSAWQIAARFCPAQIFRYSETMAVTVHDREDNKLLADAAFVRDHLRRLLRTATKTKNRKTKKDHLNKTDSKNKEDDKEGNNNSLDAVKKKKE
jgi:hypothetical protein